MQRSRGGSRRWSHCCSDFPLRCSLSCSYSCQVTNFSILEFLAVLFFRFQSVE
ncbi:hypothetical protein NC651_037219 [Populus alba x Populus x berolinensis]|nr:hypothetical protein NC651_037219 [Populus alba x Populus x berolinensis]